MARRLLVVERRLWLRDKGLILDPGIIPVGGEPIGVGSQVVLRRPDGSTCAAVIRGTSTDSGSATAGRIRLLLDEVGRDDVPIGTEVWSND
ncbi:hypothetical protein P12x_000613 [Tundrisphaera lichenicola]|uniref:hypothetical protein n=1 Tax=Tundrisphaera lichenicola TaxID=2029860 RepID=UPI003EBED23E